MRQQTKYVHMYRRRKSLFIEEVEKMDKEKYETPEVEFIWIDEDIVAASGGLEGVESGEGDSETWGAF